MEGGERKKTRRERWWDEGRRLNPVLVERTGGKGWGELGMEDKEREDEVGQGAAMSSQGTVGSG